MLPAIVGIIASTRQTLSKLLANFTATPVEGSSPLEVQFTSTSTGSPISFNWDFGNGITSTDQNPLVTFDSNIRSPALLFHFDNSVVDTVGHTVTAAGGSFLFETAANGFQQRLINIDAKWIVQDSEVMWLGDAPWTLDAKLKLNTAQGGVILCKNYWPSEPPPGTFSTDFVFTITNTQFHVTWSGLVGSVYVDYAFPIGTEFLLSVSDDGVLMRVFVDGVLVGSTPSCATRTPLPPVGAGLVILMGSLQGFQGSTPNFGAGFSGTIDELRFVLDGALYTTSFVPKIGPFSVLPWQRFDVALEVSDGASTSTVTKPDFISIDFQGMTPVITGATSFYVDTTVLLSATSSSPSSDAIFSDYQWTVQGDISIVGADNQATVTITSTVEGSGSVTLTLTDTNGVQGSTTQNMLVTAVPVLPIMVFSLEADAYTSGQLWTNLNVTPADGSLQTAYDFALGSTTGVAGDDPTYISSAETSHWTFNGSQYFTMPGTSPTFLKELHKAGTKFTIEAWVYFDGASASNVAPIFDSGTSDHSGPDMSRGVMFADFGSLIYGSAGNSIRIKQDNSGASALDKRATAALTTGWHMLACSIDATGSTPSFLYRDGGYDAVGVDDTWTATLVNPGTQDASAPPRIAARGDAAFKAPNGTKLMLLRVYNTNLSKSELDASWTVASQRFANM